MFSNYLRQEPEGMEESLNKKKRSLSEYSTDGDGNAHFSTSVQSSSGLKTEPAGWPSKKRHYPEITRSPRSSPQKSTTQGPIHRKTEGTAARACRKAMDQLVAGTIMGPPFP